MSERQDDSWPSDNAFIRTSTGSTLPLTRTHTHIYCVVQRWLKGSIIMENMNWTKWQKREKKRKRIHKYLSNYYGLLYILCWHYQEHRLHTGTICSINIVQSTVKLSWFTLTAAEGRGVSLFGQLKWSVQGPHFPGTMLSYAKLLINLSHKGNPLIFWKR